MSNLPLVSVLMPLYNKAAYVAEAIESVLNQTYANIELIIIDDGSTDDGLNIATRYASKRVFVSSQKNQGASATRNAAFKKSKGDFIQYLDSDDLLHPEKINEQMKRIMENSLTITTSHWQYFIESTILQKQEYLALFRDFDNLTDFLLKTMHQGFPIHSWLIPRLVVERAGNWDEEISIFDDKDFIMRVISVSECVKFCHSAYCYYRMPQSDSHLSAKRNKLALVGALKYLDNAELCLKKLNSKETTEILRCLYKKLLIIATNDIEIIHNIKQRSFRLGFVPDCNQSSLIYFCQKILGLRFTFWLVYLRAKYFHINIKVRKNET